MKLPRDPFRIELRSAKLCMELDCNTIFDAGMHRYCPTCGSVEFYPLESWLNRDRLRKPARAASGADTAVALRSTPRELWLDQLRRARSDSDRQAGPGAAPRRALRWRVG